MPTEELERKAALESLVSHRVLTLNNGKVKFHPAFLVKISDEIINILYANVHDPALLSELRKDRVKLMRLAVCNVVLRLFSTEMSLALTSESLQLLDWIIVEALSGEIEQNG